MIRLGEVDDEQMKAVCRMIVPDVTVSVRDRS